MGLIQTPSIVKTRGDCSGIEEYQNVTRLGTVLRSICGMQLRATVCSRVTLGPCVRSSKSPSSLTRGAHFEVVRNRLPDQANVQVGLS